MNVASGSEGLKADEYPPEPTLFSTQCQLLTEDNERLDGRAAHQDASLLRLISADMSNARASEGSSLGLAQGLSSSTIPCHRNSQ
jgi:hypothetical protein